MTYLEIVRAQLVIDEGRRGRPYRDSVGKITIGIGRNLTDDGLTPAEIDFLFDTDVREAEFVARKIFPTFEQLTDPRKAVLMNMAFNLGEHTLSQFVGTIDAVTAGEYNQAADRMLASRWAQEVGLRAVRLANAMREG